MNIKSKVMLSIILSAGFMGCDLQTIDTEVKEGNKAEIEMIARTGGYPVYLLKLDGKQYIYLTKGGIIEHTPLQADNKGG